VAISSTGNGTTHFQFRDLEAIASTSASQLRHPIHGTLNPRSSYENKRTSHNDRRGDCRPRHHHGVFRASSAPPLTHGRVIGVEHHLGDRAASIPPLCRAAHGFIEDEYYTRLQHRRSDPVRFGTMRWLPVEGLRLDHRRDSGLCGFYPAWSRAAQADSLLQGPAATVRDHRPGVGFHSRTRWLTDRP